MNITSVFTHISLALTLPTAIILLGIALFLTYLLKLPQLWCLPRCFYLLAHGVHPATKASSEKTVGSLYALFTAMSTSLGIGTLVGPSIAIVVGGPGALFWMLVYEFFAAVTKYTEVVFGIHYRTILSNGLIIGGPMQYLQQVSPWLALWYSYATVALFLGWSALQTNVLAELLAAQGLPEWSTGILLAFLVLIMLKGGAQRIGAFNSTLVPAMFVLYVFCCLFILIQNFGDFLQSIWLMLQHTFSGSSLLGGFIATSVYRSFSSGITKGAYVSESGIGTAAIAHALADVEKPTDQAILAMASAFIEIVLCFLSGIITIMSGVWLNQQITNKLLYHAFGHYYPTVGPAIILISISLFAIGTVIGNSFNTRQSFATLTGMQGMNLFIALNCVIIVLGAVADVPLLWMFMDCLMPFIAIPHILGLGYLALIRRNLLEA